MRNRFHSVAVVACGLFCAVAAVSAQIGDFNADGLVDCQDMSLLEAEIREPSGQSQFDLDDSGTIDVNDRDWLLGAASDALGYASPMQAGDANLDGIIDHLDLNIFALHHREAASGWCEADFFGDGVAGHSDDRVAIQISWQASVDPNVPGNRFAAPITTFPPTPTLNAWSPTGFTFAQTEHFQLVSIPQRAPAGLLATVLAIRTTDATDEVVTFTELAVTGDLHQTWLSGPFGQPTARPITPGALYAEDWVAADSHVLIADEDLGDRAGGGYHGISEVNDGSNPVGLDESLPSLEIVGEVLFPPSTGLGDVRMAAPTDAFFLFKTRRSNAVDFAYLVTPASLPETGAVGEVFLTLGVLGGDANNQPIPYEGILGFDEPLAIPFFAEPCDFNADGLCNVDDLNQLLAALGTENSRLDLDRSDSVIDLADRDAWLADASAGRDITLVSGDTDLDGDVDAADLNNLARHWQVSGELGWQAGDFDGNSSVDSSDLNVLGSRWQHGVVTMRAVPESTGTVWLFVGIAVIFVRLRRM